MYMEVLCALLLLASQSPSEVLSHKVGKWLLWDVSPDVFTLKPFSHATHRQCGPSPCHAVG